MNHGKVFSNTLLNRFSSWLQGTIIFPNGVAISGAFWIAYAFDPELAYNSWDHRYRPFYLCHVQHSFILLLSTLEALFRPHRKVKNSSQSKALERSVYLTPGAQMAFWIPFRSRSRNIFHKLKRYFKTTKALECEIL